MTNQNNHSFRGVRWLCDDFSYNHSNEEDRCGDYFLSEVLNRPRNEIAFGSAMSTASEEFTGFHRQIYECDEWVFYYNTLLKKKDPVIQAIDGDFGNDWTEGDLPEILERLNNNPAAIEWLESNGFRREYQINQEDALAHADFGLLSTSEDNEYSEFDLSGLNIQNVDFGYTPPRDKYDLVERKWHTNSYKEAAERRKRYLKETMDELYNIGLETQFVRSEASNFFEHIEAYLDRVREVYNEDKKIREEWNDEEKTLYRNLYHQMMRNQGLDEETIRRNLYSGFDRVRTQTWDIYQDGKFYKTFFNRPSKEKLEQYNSIALAGKMTKPSFWDKCKSNAFTRLTLTSQQWKRVYNIAWSMMFNRLSLMARTADTAEKRLLVRNYTNKYQERLGGPKQAQAIRDLMPKRLAQ